MLSDKELELWMKVRNKNLLYLQVHVMSWDMGRGRSTFIPNEAERDK